MKQKKNRSGLDGQHGEFAGQRREAGTLCETAGVMPWSKRRRASVDMRSRSELMELLENRVLLSGDHPSMPVPFSTVAPATAMTFDIAGVSRVNGTLAAGDPGDWFRFDVVAPDFVTVLANTAGLGSTANTRVQVFDSNGVEVAMGTDNGEITGTSPLTVSDGWTRFISSPGTYFVHVTSQFNTTGDYQLRVRRLTSGIDPINLVTGDAAASAGVIVEPQGEQVFFLDTPANIMGMADFNSLVTITSTVDLNLPANQRLDTRIEVYDETGAPVPNAEDSDTGYLTSAFSTWRAEPNQRYYVRVRSDRLTGTQATGVFTLIFDFAAQELAVQVDPVTRRGEDRTQSLTNPFDSRLFRFRAEGTGLGFITVRDLGPPNLPPELGFGVRIFDFDGNLLAFDDDFNGVNEPQIEIPVVGGATYFVVVDSFEPPATPTTQQPFGLFVEASHTFDRLQPVDDHIGVPTGGTPGAIRRQFDLATPLTFGQPVLPNDVLLRSGNGFVFDERIPALDRSYEITANATGRIHEDGDPNTPADSDLFRFVAPVDMLGSYAGNNDNAGSALYVGGAFTVADPNSLGFLPSRGVENVPSRGLSLFDAASWWFAGPQVQAADGNTLGFNDNVNTPGTAGAEIYAMTVWDPDGPANPFFGPMLVVAGDFTLTVDDTFGGGPGAGTFSFNNIAVWGNITPTAAPALNFPGPTGYSWINPLFYGLLLGSANQPVRALTTFDEDGAGPNPPLLFAGGDFTSIGLPGMETMANRLAKMGPDLAWQAVGTGITGGANPSVRALTVYDPPDPGPGMPPGVPDAPNAPQQLVVGGSFTNAGGTAVNNIAFWGFASDMAMAPAYSRLGTVAANGVTGNNGQNAPGGAATGVYALSVWDPPMQPNMVDPDPLLVVGGNFTAVAGVTGATNNIALFGSPVTGMTEPMTNPRLLWLRDVTGIPMDMTVATTPGTNPGFNSTVFALATWDPPDFAGQPPVEPLVAVGGAFSMSGMVPAGNFGLYFGAAANQAFGNYDGIVRAITVMRNDTQEFGINHFTNTDDDREVLYIGGEFQNVQLGMAVTNASRVVQLDAAGTPGGMAGGFGYSPLRNGVDATVFSLIQFDDTNPTFDDSALLWDRNDRPSSRISITVTPTTDSFLNSTVRIYDGAFNIIYTNDLRDPAAGGTDPSGSFNRALGPGLPNIGPALWGGSTYYIEVIGGGGVRQDGRYNLSVTIDAYPPDINNDGAPDDTVSQLFEAPGEGSWTSAQRLTIDNVLSGDTNNDIGDPATSLPVWLSPGNQFDGYSIGSGPGRRRIYGQGFPADVQVPTPSGFFVAQQTDFAAIETIEDTDLYFFRANASGYFEVRINTTNIAHEFTEEIWDYSSREGNATLETNALQQTISSPLASLLTIFNNDLQVVTTSSYNPSVQGESSTTTVGTLGERVFWHRDARVVFEVQAGQVYFIQVESAQRAQFMLDPNQVDFGVATGTYELMLNGLSDFNPDNSDDHASGFNPANGANTATPVPIDTERGSPTNGQGSVIGTIRDVFNSQQEPNNDLDLFSYYATSTGTVRLTGAARNSSTVALSLTVIDDAGMTVVTGAALQGGSTTVTWFAQQGERYFVRVDGAGGSQGDYILNFEGAPDVDDHVNVPAFADGTEVTVNRFLGTITGSGRIENAGDNDVFQFNSSQYVPDIRNQATVRVRSTSPASLDVQVRVYEVQVDLEGNEYRALIGLNDDETDENNPNGPPLSNDAFARFSISPNRTYYIVVEGEDPNVDFGDYNFTVSMNPTDDHPDFVAFPLSSDIALTTDVNVGAIGSRAGRIEIPIDDDVFRFTAQASGMATVTLTQAVAGSFDSVMRIFDSSQTLITSGVGDMSGNITLSFAVARGAAYTIVVDVNSGTPTDADYTVSVVSPPNDDHPNEGEFPLASTIFLSSTTGTGTRTGEIRPSGTDTDLFRVTTRVAGALVINLTTPGSNLNPRIQVFNSSFVLLPGSSDDAESASQTIMASAVNQVFYILVRSDTVGGGDQVGSYTITASQTIPGGGGGGGGGGGTDDHANAGNFDGATPIALNTRTGDGTATGIINFVGDTDLFSFVTATFQPGVSGTRPVYLQITTPTGGLVDGTVRVFDDSMAHNVVAMDSNGVPGATANLVFQASPGTRYFVLVEPVASNQGSYVVRLDTEPNTHFLYYPEGYSSSAIDEFIPIVNPNNFAVTYSIIARYETGTRDEVIVTNAVIPANSRGGHTVSTRGTNGASMVRRDTPYALEIQANGQLTATFSHYDFGITTGENFTNRTSTTWAFSEVRKDVLNFRDFVLYYNPNNVAANLTVSLVYDDGQVVTFNRTVDAFRRSGLNFTNDSAIPREGRFALQITSDQPIVAALSSYRITGARGGFGLLGNADGGATRGAIPLISTGSGVDSSISVYNANTAQSASVTITATYLNAGLPDLVRVVSVGANARRTFTLAELGLVPGLQAGVRYQASIPVTVTYAEYQNGDANATMFGTTASQTALFGDAFVNPQAAGTTYIENLAIYNPASFETDVTIRFLFNDGSVSAPITRRVAGGGYDVIRVDQQDAILNRPGLAFFSIRVDAISPIVTYFTHYDLFLNGGWSTLGAPVGLTNPVSTIG